MGKRLREERAGYTKSEVRRLCAEKGYRLDEYGVYHMRVFGLTTVDYWPSAQKAWVTGTYKKAVPATPEELLEIASHQH